MIKKNRKITEDIRDGKLIRITKESWQLVKFQKLKQGKSIARIVSNLIIKEYKNENNINKV